MTAKTDANAATPEKKLKGCFDTCDRNAITGWVIDESAPDQPVVIDIIFDGKPAVQATANMFRPDLKDAGIGNGCCAFHIAMPERYFDGKEHKVAIRENETQWLLSGSNKTITLPFRPSLNQYTANYETTIAEKSRVKHLKAHVDRCDDREASGWIVDDSAPGQPLEVELYIDDQYAARTLANDFREDLLAAGIGDGHCAFRLAVPALTPGKTARIEIREPLTGLMLTASSSSFALAPTVNTGNAYFLHLIDQRKTVANDATLAELPIQQKQRIIEYCYPLIDLEHVLSRLPDASDEQRLTAIVTAAVHPHPLFDNAFYRAEARRYGFDAIHCPVLHYLQTGWKLGLNPHPLFDGAYYRIDTQGAASIDREIDPLTAFILSKEESSKPPSPFVDLAHLRHVMKTTRLYDYVSDAQLLADALSEEWVALHPHLDRTQISFLTAQDHAVFENPNATMQDLCQLVTNLRHGVPMPHIEQPGAPSATLSTIVLNFNKPVYTLISAYSVFNATYDSAGSECLVVDNGSEPFFVEVLHRYCRHLTNVKVISLKENRYFGEGNNIGFDHSQGERILFLNNDAVIRRDTIMQLMAALDNHPELGAVAPVMVLPNGQIQEAGGVISGCGQIIQKSKFIAFSAFAASYRADDVRHCDYASAAACLMPRATLQKVLGFDYIFEPFYYEDTDLCARIHAQGLKIGVCLNAYAVHIENASTKELLGGSFGELIASQRQKFVDRWNGLYEDLAHTEAAAISARHATAQNYQILTDLDTQAGYSQQSVAWVYTPFDIAIGGGERYIISLAMALSTHHETWLLTPRRYSRARLAMVMEDLGLAGGKLHLATLDATGDWARPDLYIAMGNEIEPPTAPLGLCNIHHCQFPFPVYHAGHFALERINRYDAILVNSQFTASNIQTAIAKYRLRDVPITVVAPPVAIPTGDEQRRILARKYRPDNPLTIVNIGRFAQGGHDKRQDAVLRIAKVCAEQGLNIQFELYGGVSNRKADTEHFARLCSFAQDLNVKIKGNATRADLSDALTRAHFYLHTCGLGYYPGLAPERIEHFGITVVEAMAHGAIPLVYEWGGPAEILTGAGLAGKFATLDDAVALIAQLIDNPPSERLALAEKAIAASRLFDEERFAAAIVALTRQCLTAHRKLP